MHKSLKEVSKEAPQPGAAFLSFHRELMVSAIERLLELGLDISDHHHPQVVPVPIARHPKTKAEARRWEAKIAFRIDEYMLAFAVTGTGTHVIHATVGKEALAEALTPYLDQPHALTKATILNSLSGSNLNLLALACVIWLMEPIGPMKNRREALDAASFERMQYAMEITTMNRVALQAKGSGGKSEAEKLAASNAMAGWSLSSISLAGRAGGRLRRALGAEAPYSAQYTRLLQDLPAVTQIAWEDRQPEEPLRPTGNRDRNLTRRVSAMLERDAREAAMRPEKVNDDTQSAEEFVGTEDPELEEFQLKESVRQDLNRLELWIEKAKLSEQERRVYELDMLTDHNTTAISQKLQIGTETVRQYRKRYRDKLRTAARL